ncbi:adenosylcobinamide kinase/adenosylcobinamide phosphate guanyltransferase [Cohnella xylanilytica]|uniref:bifunctional adenosylcobinamide kinase/adenosylcobinamide-phosphate guanylyltransferase n=1 Tax=Cohnella xylanilytica TaxID=557555 RepID=UPI001B1EB9C9|nr:bifunctional adenosylcobinamide kinase/adenosylcobinamide-phosphate guanylyltransferase [Cohnella xylanilytica]GIO10496.1 adenosylcobinamide kinase/adenosylcobinamide phosphate guanyltransferase [Cohnella xylanilytica]
MVVLVTGGARSGKSSFAEQYAAHQAESGIYIATAQALDAGMRDRIAHHRSQREKTGFRWETVEEPLDLVGTLRRASAAPVVLVDCLTLWLTNVLLEKEDEGEEAERRVMPRIEELRETLEGYPGRAILVTNEVGDGIVPEYPLGRLYRDLAGILNQRIASVSDEVFLVTAGIPVELRRIAYRWPEERA